ncbi:MAG: transketolase [Gemmatimonadota bacterium]
MPPSPVTKARLLELQRLALRARRLIVETVHGAGAGHLGGPLSAADLLTALYFEVMEVDPDQPQRPDRDRFVLSKGHASVGLYAVLALRGFLPVEELATFDALDSRLQGHPDMTVLDCLDASTGSLGQGLSVGLGMALAARLRGWGCHTWVLLGDGDTQEGQTWEAAFVAERYDLANLTTLVDCNGLQQYGWAAPGGYGKPERRPPQDDLARKWEAFGWDTVEIDGHDMAQIVAACRRCAAATRPTAILARTVKGKGISFMEGDYTWHARVPTEAELARARDELAAAEVRLG